ncbi:MAG: isochorismatase family protein [Fimbriimonadaceae bacterium]|nr:isochorismatase family protein [Fimbriimonadaceae bacterium]
MSDGPFELPVRWYPTIPAPDQPGEETANSHLARRWPLRPAQSALLLVDCWDTHELRSHERQSAAIVDALVVPTRKACRAAGIAVIHAPSAEQARHYPQWTRLAGDAELGWVGGPPGDPWPPREFRQRTGEWAPLQRPHYLRDVAATCAARRIMPALTPHDDEWVVLNGAHLHRVCRHLGVLHLLVAGFAANMCVLYRDYGIKAMSERGYNTVLLRDATLAIEAAETWQSRQLTAAAVLAVEMLWGVTATTSDLRQALAERRDGV